MSELTENQWKIAHIIARQLVQEGTDVNELKKATAYLRTCVDVPEGGKRFFKYLQNLVFSGDKISHSKRTLDYYRSLNRACCQYIQPLQDTPQMMLDILGWVGRLVAYYQEAPIAELLEAPMDVVVESSKQAAIRQAAQTMDWAIGLAVVAEVDKIDGNKVTYKLPGEIRLTQKKPKRISVLEIGQAVQVEVLELRESGVPKKVKLLE